MKRNFNDWLGKFRESIADYDYYIDFPKIYKNVDAIRIKYFKYTCWFSKY